MNKVRLEMIPIKSLVRSPLNPRIPRSTTTLKNNIYNIGQIEPLIVRSNKNSQIEVLNGGRRLRAMEQAGVLEALCLFVDMDDVEANKLIASLDAQREELNPWERGKCYSGLCKSGITEYGVSQIVQVSPMTVSNCVRIYEKLSPKIAEAWTTAAVDHTKNLTASKALLLIQLPEDMQIALFNQIVLNGLSELELQEQVERLKTVREATTKQTDTKKVEEVNEYLKNEINIANPHILNALSEELGTKTTTVDTNMDSKVDFTVARERLLTKIDDFRSEYPGGIEISEDFGDTLVRIKSTLKKENN